MADLSTALEEHKTQLQAHLTELQEELQRRKDKDNLRVGSALKTISREIDDWEHEARACDDADEAAQHQLKQQARDLRARLMKLRSE